MKKGFTSSEQILDFARKDADRIRAEINRDISENPETVGLAIEAHADVDCCSVLEVFKGNYLSAIARLKKEKESHERTLATKVLCVEVVPVIMHDSDCARWGDILRLNAGFKYIA